MNGYRIWKSKNSLGIWLNLNKLKKFKNFEFEIDLFKEPINFKNRWFQIIYLELEKRSKVSHAGVFFSFSLLNLLNLQISYFDSRHWNNETDDFITPIH